MHVVRLSGMSMQESVSMPSFATKCSRQSTVFHNINTDDVKLSWQHERGQESSKGYKRSEEAHYSWSSILRPNGYDQTGKYSRTARVPLFFPRPKETDNILHRATCYLQFREALLRALLLVVFSRPGSLGPEWVFRPQPGGVILIEPTSLRCRPARLHTRAILPPRALVVVDREVSPLFL